MRERTALRTGGRSAQLADLERAALAQNAQHEPWECTAARMRRTRGGRALYMHCLPADITGVNCRAGEVSRDVFEAARLDTYREAAYKPFVVAALVLATRVPDAVDRLRRLADRLERVS
jgi:ornithine carbamoyltransferase